MTLMDPPLDPPFSRSKVCIACLIARPIDDFPSRGAGKTRTRCTRCFRENANSKRRKENETKDISDLPVAICLTEGCQSNWVEVVLQILTDKKFLVISDASSGDELIDLKVLLKTENRIAKLVEKEMESEKGSHLSPRFDRRASEGRRRLDQEPN